HEYNIAAPAVGLTREQVHQSQPDGLNMAFLSNEEKANLQLKITKGTAL
ncbi:MAG: adenosine deaminase, partial [Gammaproteobacteria bacterium]|nr:adenosine deaminase [Gammaproteobacteria bacterium]